MDLAFHNTVPLLMQAITTSISLPSTGLGERRSALKCLEAWIGWGLPAKYINFCYLSAGALLMTMHS